jgi:hypothetical protein
MDLEETRRAFARGDAVTVWIGDTTLPVGDIGNPRTDARLLLTLLAADGRAAELLRAFGIDERAARALDGSGGTG